MIRKIELMLLGISLSVIRIPVLLHIVSPTDYHQTWFMLFCRRLVLEGYRVENRKSILANRGSNLDLIVYTEAGTFLFFVKKNALGPDVEMFVRMISEIEDIPDPKGILVCESSIPEVVQGFAEQEGVQFRQGIEGIKEKVLACRPTKEVLCATT